MIASNSRMAFGIGTAFSALAAASLAAGCGEEFKDCAASRTCPPARGGNAGSAGTAGAAAAGHGGTSGGEGAHGGTASGSQGGEGGESGAASGGRGGGGPVPTDAGATGDAGAAGAGGDGNALPTTCDRDSDCRDRNACNGVETCEAGECVFGTPVECENVEPTRCAATCETVDGEAVCGHVGLDADEDGHKSAACSLNSGDDCNDHDDSIHPGAAETCDGVDSDCDSNADADEDEVVVTGNVDVLVARDDASQAVLSANIAGFGEKATAHAGAPFAVAWTYRSDDCVFWQTNLIASNASMMRVAGSDSCNSRQKEPIDVVALPEVLTATVAVSPLNNGAFSHFLDSATQRLSAKSTLSEVQSLSFKNSEYSLLLLEGTATTPNTVTRRDYSRDLEPLRDETVDTEGEHIALAGAHGGAVWTLRKSSTLDQVFAEIGGGPVAISSGTASASHPLMAWSEENAFAVAWRYSDGRMRFKHFDDDCEVGVGEGFPGELAATPRGYVLVSLSENKREVVARLIGPACKPGPRTVLVRVEDGDADELADSKIAVTGGYLRAMWKRVTGDGTALESRQFRWDECE